MRVGTIAFGVFVVAFSPLTAQESPGDSAIEAYVARKARALEATFLPDVKSREDFEQVRPRLREEYFYSLGLWPLPERGPLEARVTGQLSRGDFTVEKVHFQSRPRLYVTGNLYRPAKTDGAKLPAVLYVCGHSAAGRNGNKVQFQDHEIWFAKHGYVCLAIDTLQLGEIGATHHGTYREGRWWWHSAGYTSAGVECWNGVRAIDYLVSRPDVDPERIAVTGISGGGAATFWIAAADERVRVAVPVSGMADLESYVAHKVVDGHCDCMFLYNTFRWNWTTIAALICPRPLLFMNSDKDSIFPMDANERVIARLERLYALHGAGGDVDAVVSIGGHAYRTDLRKAAFQFINAHLKGDARAVDDADVGLGAGEPPVPQIPFEELRVFPRDEDIPADQLNTRIDESFAPRPRPALFETGRLDAWRSGLLSELSRVAFGAWPASSLEALTTTQAAALQGSLSTEPDVRIWWRKMQGFPRDAESAWVVIVAEREPWLEPPEWARKLAGGAPMIVVAPRGSGPAVWTRKNPPNTIERSLVLIGETADGGRVYDVKTAVRELKRAMGLKNLTLAGRGATAVIAAYAAAYAPEVDRLVAVEPPASHAPREPGGAYGPSILNALRVLDIPEVFGLLAPRRLDLVGVPPADFQRTSEIYDRAGASGALSIH